MTSSKVVWTCSTEALTILKRIRDSAVDPETGQKKGPTFPISKAAALVGRTASAVREAGATAASRSRADGLRA
jgi:hypothetical protein